MLADGEITTVASGPKVETVQAYRPFTLRCVYIAKNFGICIVMVFKVASHLGPPLELNSLPHLFILPGQELFPLCSLIAFHSC